MDDCGIEETASLCLPAVILFCIAPHMSEVLVWEPSFHFLQGFLLILLMLNWVRNYLKTHEIRYVWLAGIAYLLSTFSLEICYITPWLVLALIIFYQFGTRYSAGSGKALLYFFVPQIAAFLFHLVLFHYVYGEWVAHIGGNPLTSALTGELGKTGKHLFNTLLLGRYWPDAARHKAYELCDSLTGIYLLYGILVAGLVFIVARFRKMSPLGRVLSLFFVWVIPTLLILIPLWFQNLFIVVYDRYVYFTCGFLYVVVAIAFRMMLPIRIRGILIFLLLLINLRFTIQANRFWMKSERVISSLLLTIPVETNKTIVLLNIPQNMHGVPMIGAERESEFKLMHDLLLPAKKIASPVYDAMAYNMLTPDDGANVTVVNDSTIKVTLNQWGTWWWYAMQGGVSYSNAEYSIDMKDGGHYYELTLKHAAQNYLLLYQVGSVWKRVDMKASGEQR